MASVKGTLHDLCNIVKSKSDLQNTVCAITAGVSEEELEDLQQEYSITIDPVVRAFFETVNGFQLNWEYHEKSLTAAGNYVEGSARLLDFHRMFKGFDGRQWLGELWFDDMPEQELDFLTRLKVLDYYGKDSVQCVCLEVTEENVLSSNLWLYYQGMAPLLMNFRLDEYIEKLNSTKAIWGWQFFYTNISLLDGNNITVRRNCEFILEWYEKIFPDDMISELKNRYQQLLKV